MPESGSTVSSPVRIEAGTTVTGPIANMQLWIDGVQRYTTPGTTLSAFLSVAAGTHRFAVVVVNRAGQKWDTAVNAETVK